MAETEQRPRFYEGQYLQAADLSGAVGYARSQLARTQLAGHTWGIALGLEILDSDAPNNLVQPVITPGYAWDGFGRAIVLTDRVNLSSALFSQFDAGAIAGDPPIAVEVWLRYREEHTAPPRAGFETCRGDDEMFGRVIETYRVEVGPKSGATLRSEISSGGLEFDATQALATFGESTDALADASVPYQDLPEEGDNRFWLIPIGVVAWQPGTPGSFAKRTDAQMDFHRQKRRLCGVVAEAIEATGGHVRIHDRLSPYSPDHTGELLWVEGESRFDGHVRLYASHLELSASHSEPSSPFRFLRDDDAAAGTKKLQISVGDETAGHNRLAIGPQIAGTETYEEHVVVMDDGNVGIGLDASPKALLHLREEGGFQIGEKAIATENFYLDVDANGTRALRLYNGDFGAGNPMASFAFDGKVGFGSTAPTNQLEVKGALGIRQNKLYLSGDASWNSVSFNAHHDSANGSWVFPDPVNPAVTIEMDNAGNSPRFEVYSTTNAAKQTWVSRLRVNGDNGTIALAHNGGNVGVGLTNPLAKLDVSGSIRSSGDLTFAANALHAAGAPTALRIAWGTISDSQVKEAGEGFANPITKLGPGRYQITFSPPFTSTPAASVTRIHLTSGATDGTNVKPRENAILDLLTATQMVVTTGDDNGILVDAGFSFIVMGPR